MPSPMMLTPSKGINQTAGLDGLRAGELFIARNSYYLPEDDSLYKIPGNALFGAVGAALTGVHFVRFRSGNAFLAASAGTAYYTAPVGATGTWTSRASGLTAVGRSEAVYHQATDRLYMADGVNSMRVWTGSGNMRAAGLTAPDAATIALVANAATDYLESSIYSYCHTEYDSTNDIESAPSSVKNIQVTTDGDTIKYSFPATAKNAGSLDKYRLYRTQNGGSVFYLLAEVASTTTNYYDGDDSEALGNGVDNEDVWTFTTLDDIFLSTQNVLPMVGTAIDANHITVNGTIPVGTILGEFDGSLYIAGVSGYPQDLYFSLPRRPEQFSPVNVVRVRNPWGDPIVAVGEANDWLIIFTLNTIHRLNRFPLPTDPGFGLFNTVLKEVTRDNGCVARRSVVNFGVGQPSNQLFYVSIRGPMATNGDVTIPLHKDLNWSSDQINFSKISLCMAKVYPKLQQIWLWVPSKDSDTLDMAFIYHYGPDHVKYPLGNVGKWTGPIHKRAAGAAVAFESDVENRLYVADSDSSGNVYLEDTGVTDAQNYDDATGKIWWEWMTGDHELAGRSKSINAARVFVTSSGVASTWTPGMSWAKNGNDLEHALSRWYKTETNSNRLTKVGTSHVTLGVHSTYRAAIDEDVETLRLHVDETAAAARDVSKVEVEGEGRGAQL